MRRLLVFVVLAVSLQLGCASEQEQVLQTGQSINLMPSKEEAGLPLRNRK
jgi:uncharacterized protein YcfL